MSNTAKQMNVENDVIFPGYIPIEDLPHFYADCAALLFPSKYEGFGFPPLEAMACGAPVITTRCASIPEVCAGAAIYVDPDGTADISNALKRIAKSAELKNSCEIKSLKQAALFSWEKCAGEYMNLFKELIK